MKRNTDIAEIKKILLKHGFKRMNTKGWLDKYAICYEHTKNGWFADIIDRGGNWADCFLAGKGLLPGGYVHSVRSLEEELNRFIEKVRHDKTYSS